MKGENVIAAINIDGVMPHQGGMTVAYLDGHVEFRKGTDSMKVLSDYSMPYNSMWTIDFSKFTDDATARAKMLTLFKTTTKPQPGYPNPSVAGYWDKGVWKLMGFAGYSFNGLETIQGCPTTGMAASIEFESDCTFIIGRRGYPTYSCMFKLDKDAGIPYCQFSTYTAKQPIAGQLAEDGPHMEITSGATRFKVFTCTGYTPPGEQYYILDRPQIHLFPYRDHALFR
jgi:prepilin-type processing-associated H-X9-DG protein